VARREGARTAFRRRRRPGVERSSTDDGTDPLYEPAVTGYKVEPQFRLYASRLVNKGVSCVLRAPSSALSTGAG